MYHIEQLRSKEIADLQSIAQELGIKGIKSLDRDSLIYRILDGQAMQNSKAGAPAVVKEENRMNRREHRRNRIHNDAPSKVYTANGDKAVKLDKNEPAKAKQVEPQLPEPKPAPAAAPESTPASAPVEVVEPKKTVESAPVVEAAPEAVTALIEQKSQPKKRGRKSKAEKTVKEENVAVEAVVEENVPVAESSSEATPVVAEEKVQGKKRGRKPKNKQEQPAAQPAVEPS